MNNNGNAIKIDKQQVGVSVWEAHLIYRLRQLTARGDGEFILRKQGDEVTICRIGKPEVVKG